MRNAVLALVVGLTLALAAPALAMRCPDWGRLDEESQRARITSMIDARLEGSRGKKWTSIDRGAMRRCLMGRLDDIRYAFDNECTKQNRRRLDEVLTSWLYTCSRG